MAVAKELTTYSWILETNTGDKLGLISYNQETEAYLVIAADMEIPFTTWDELSSVLGEKVKIDERVRQEVTFKEIDGYVIFHEKAVDIIHQDDGVITYRANEKSKTRYYAGYWVCPNTEKSTYRIRATLPDKTMDQFITEGYEVFGPYKDRIQANFQLKQVLNDKKASEN